MIPVMMEVTAEEERFLWAMRRRNAEAIDRQLQGFKNKNEQSRMVARMQITTAKEMLEQGFEPWECVRAIGISAGALQRKCYRFDEKELAKKFQHEVWVAREMRVNQ